MDMTWYDELEARIPAGTVRTRFAPSPTGYMHVGNLRTALYTWLIARKNKGTFIFRLEDTDQTRQVEGATELIYRTMNECGLTHDEGPDVGGPVGPYIQTERRGLYGKYAELLAEKGHAYYCFCEKAESEEDSGDFQKGEDPCRSLTPQQVRAMLDEGKPYVIRQKIPHEGTTTFSDASFGDITVENSTLDDQVLLKRDGLPTYNFANVIDDHLMGITHVVRGSEYLSSAPKYNLLYEAFGWEIPTYIHCSPVMRDAQHKMSKRHGDPSYEDLRAQGYLTDAILNYVALLGWSPKGDLAEQEFFTLDELVEAFDITGISKSPAIFDLEKLNYFNSEYIKRLSPEAFLAAAEPYLKQAIHDEGIDLSLVAPLVQTRLNTLTEIPPMVDFFDELPEYGNDLYVHKKMKTNAENSLEALKLVVPVFEGMTEWTFDSVHDALIGLAAANELKNGRIMWPVRVAVSGKPTTPGGAVELCHILGKEETLRRIQKGIEQLTPKA